jgi:hypothetical protein
VRSGGPLCSLPFGSPNDAVRSGHPAGTQQGE